MFLKDQRVFVIGGTSGIGLGAAKAAVGQGARVTVASRSADKVNAAKAELGPQAEAVILDTVDEAGVERFFAEREAFHHVVVSASKTKVAAVRELALADAYASMNSKFWGAYRIARAARIEKGGSLTLVSGFLSVRPRKGAAIQSAINAAVEGLTRGLALEFAPVRVNAVSPGLIVTPMYDGLQGDSRKAMFDDAAARLPVGLVGQPEHVAIQILAFMANPFMTGSVVYVDGGGVIA